MSRRVLIAAVLVLAFGAAPADASTCSPKGSTTIARFSTVRVYRTEFKGDLESVGYACVLKTGRRFQLDDPNFIDPTFLSGPGAGANNDRTTRPKLAGRFMVFKLEYAEDTERLEIIDLKTGKRHSLGGGGDGERYLDRFVVTRSGAAAFTVALPNIVYVVPWERTRRVVDEGDPVDTTSLALASDRHHVTWTNAGATKTAALR